MTRLGLLLGKDARRLLRSPLLLVALVVYLDRRYFLHVLGRH